MRFAMFTVFTAVLGGLLAFPFSDGGRRLFEQSPGLAPWFGAAALLLSLLFTLGELRISFLVGFYQRAVFDDDEFPRPRGHGLWTWLIGAVMVAPYLLSAAFWVCFSMGWVAPPAAP
jgi:lysylphosphatidylglycerol synthetase-like protein (DUF2156 family)